jgi:hypothetical protein
MDPRDGLDVVAKRKNACPGKESNPGRPARNLVTILTELSEREHNNSKLRLK